MNAKGIQVKNVATLLATASLGVVSLGAVACDDDADSASAPPSASASSSPGVSSPSAAPVPSTSVSPRPTPSAKPKVTGDQVIVIDPDGKKYTRKWVIRNAMMMAGVSKKLPPNFCDKSYAEGVDEGGKFPAGKAAFMDACEEGVSLAG
jgi:hypothetical protein